MTNSDLDGYYLESNTFTSYIKRDLYSVLSCRSMRSIRSMIFAQVSVRPEKETTMTSRQGLILLGVRIVAYLDELVGTKIILKFVANLMFFK